MLGFICLETLDTNGKANAIQRPQATFLLLSPPSSPAQAKNSDANMSNLQLLFAGKLRIQMDRQMPASILKQLFCFSHHLLHLPTQLWPHLEGFHLKMKCGIEN